MQIPEGWTLAPDEPNEEMCAAFVEIMEDRFPSYDWHSETACDVYGAMMEAAPSLAKCGCCRGTGQVSHRGSYVACYVCGGSGVDGEQPTEAPAQPEPTWTAIADEKPPTMQDVLFAGEHEGKPVIHIGYLSWRDNLYVILTIGRWTPTHWMPLPAPPK